MSIQYAIILCEDKMKLYENYVVQPDPPRNNCGKYANRIYSN